MNTIDWIGTRNYHQIFTMLLPSMLHYQDRMAMYCSIENRVPFLDRTDLEARLDHCIF